MPKKKRFIQPSRDSFEKILIDGEKLKPKEPARTIEKPGFENMPYFVGRVATPSTFYKTLLIFEDMTSAGVIRGFTPRPLPGVVNAVSEEIKLSIPAATSKLLHTPGLDEHAADNPLTVDPVEIHFDDRGKDCYRAVLRIDDATDPASPYDGGYIIAGEQEIINATYGINRGTKQKGTGGDAPDPYNIAIGTIHTDPDNPQAFRRFEDELLESVTSVVDLDVLRVNIRPR